MSVNATPVIDALLGLDRTIVSTLDPLIPMLDRLKLVAITGANNCEKLTLAV